MPARWALIVLVTAGSSGFGQERLYPPLQPAWQVTAEFGFYATPTVAGGTVYAGSRDNHLYAVEAATGEVRWRVDLGGKVYGRVAYDDGRLWATAENGRVACLDADTGTIVWQRDTGGVYYAGAQLAGRLVIVGTGDTGRIAGLDRNDGSEVWSYQLGGRMGSGLAAADGRVFIPSYDRRVHCLRADNGEVIWTFAADGVVDSVPLVAGATVYVKLPDDTVYALAAADGKQVWTHEPAEPAAPADTTSNWSPLVLSGGLLMFGSQDPGVVALDAKTGQPRWRAPRATAQPAPPLLLGEVGFLGGRDGTLAAMDPASGKVFWRWAPEQAQDPGLLSGIMWPPVAAGGMLFAASCDGHLYAFRGAADPNAWREAAEREEALTRLLAGTRPVQVLTEQAPDTYKLSFTVGADGAWPRDSGAGVAFDVDASNAGYVLLAGADGLRLLRHDGPGDEVALGTVETPLTRGPVQVVVHRERNLIRVLTDGRERLSVGEMQFPPGRVLLGARTDAPSIAAPDLQPTETVWFTDDFMRAAEETGDWRELSGDWEASGVSRDETGDGRAPEAELSANPFAFRAKQPKDRAIAACGYWFWDTYRAEVSVRAEGDGTIGLAGYLLDADTYLAFEWKAAGAGQERQLVAYDAGNRTVLASAGGGWQQNQWYRLGLELNRGVIEARLDGRPILSAESSLVGEGQVALLAEDVEFADFDDLVVAGSEDFHETFSGPRPGRWKGVGGTWRIESDSPGERDPGVLAGHAGPGVLVAAGEAWDDAEVRAAGKVAAGSGLGLVAAYAGPDDYLALRWGGSGAPRDQRGKLQLVRVTKAGEQVLGERPGAPSAGAWQVLALRVHGGWIQARINNEQVFEAFDPTLAKGTAGVIATGERAVFDRLRVESILPEPKVEFTEQFTQEDTMSDWARPAGAWLTDEAGRRDGVVWHRGLFCGDSWVAADARIVRSSDRPLRMILCGDGASAGSGYVCEVRRTGDDTAVAELLVGGARVADSQFETRDDENLRLVRRGRLLALFGDNRPLLAWFDSRAATEPGRWVGLKRDGGDLDVDRIDAGTPHLYDTSFTTAPWAWHVGKGTWQTTNRWKCDPRWSFFGGYEDMNPLIWTKDDYGGDQQLEAYMAIKMNRRDGERYEHPSDLSITICGNGRDLTSGYTLMFAAENNTCALLLRNGQVIGKNDSRDSFFTHVSTDDDGTRLFHRHWFHLILRRADGRLTATVDDKVLFDVEDRDPIPGGKAALFSVQNGVMVSRAKVWFEQALAPTPFVDTDALLAGADTGEREGLAHANDFERGIGAFEPAFANHPVLLTREREMADGQYGLTLTNLVTGGEFGVLAVDEDFRLSTRPKLSFSYKAPANVAVNLYVKADDRWYMVRFLGSEQVPDGYRLIGAIDARKDDRWRRASFDLGAAFQQAGAGDPMINRLVFAMLDPVPYRHAGLDANPLLATWYLDNFELKP